MSRAHWIYPIAGKRAVLAAFLVMGSVFFSVSPARAQDEVPWRMTPEEITGAVRAGLLEGEEPGEEGMPAGDDLLPVEEPPAPSGPVTLLGPEGPVELALLPSDDEAEPEPTAAESPARMKMYEAMLNVQDGAYEEAIPKLEWVIETDPALTGAWETLGYAYWSMGRFEEAARVWRRWSVIVPRSYAPWRLLAQVAVADQDLDSAEELYRKSLALRPDHYDTRFGFARVLLWNGKFEEALAELRDLHTLDEDRLDVELQLARALFAVESYEESLEHWDRINELVPEFPDYMTARARALLLVGALDEAAAEAEAVLDLEPDHLPALRLLTDVALRARDHREVVEAMRLVMDQAESDRAKAEIARRLAYYAAGRRERQPDVFTMAECLRLASDAHELDPDDINGHLFLGELLVMDGRFAIARDHFESILKEKNPFNYRARYGLFQAQMGLMDLDAAEKQLRENLRLLNPSDPYRHLLWARLHFARGRYGDAMAALDRLEQEGAQGAVFTLLYHGLTASEWTAMPSVRQFRDHLMALKRGGFRFITPGQFEAYFNSVAPPERVPARPRLNRMLRSARQAWTGEREKGPLPLHDHVPERVAAVTFDDGMRSSFRWATPVAGELNIPMTMFVSVGHILDRDIHIVTFPELKTFHDTGWWEIGSHLMDASYLKPLDRDGRRGHPLPNTLWFEDKERRETLREYAGRLRREFQESGRLLREALGPDAPIDSVAYPMGDIGQSTDSNIELFNVPEMILNEAEIHYRRGFVQTRFGHGLKLDYPMMLQRWEPDREDDGEDVLRQAFRTHPVYVARRTRAEFAAQQGEMHQALQMIEVLKRDGYPRKDLNELTAYVTERLARLTPVPEAVRIQEAGREPRALSLRHPYLGVEGESRKANVMIDEWHAGLFGGLNLNPRLILEARVGVGRIRQEVTSNTWTEVEQTSVSQRRDVVTITEDGQTSRRDETVVTFSTTLEGTNVVETWKYRATEEMAGLALHYVFPGGSVGSLDVRQRTFGDDLEGESVVSYALDYSWRPILAVDLAARFERDAVPSAREVISYNGGALGLFWRARDGWNATGSSAYWSLSDDNSLLRLMLENFLRLSDRHDLWMGLHHSVVTTDRDSDLYWTPYWDQRHFLILRWRRSYPNTFAMVRGNVGFQRSRGRVEEWGRYNERRARARLEGWYPGTPPDESWNRIMGIGGSVRRRWVNGWEIQGEVSVNALKELTERNLSGSLRYRF